MGDMPPPQRASKRRMQNEKMTLSDPAVEYLQHWNVTWVSFNRALRSSNDFHAFQWTWRLLQAALGYIYYHSGLHRLQIHVFWRSFIPLLAWILIGLVVASYFGSLRPLIRSEWCSKSNDNCIRVHDLLVVYIGGMIFYHFVLACFRSPGVVLAKDVHEGFSESHAPSPPKWMAVHSQGGCCFLNPTLDASRERNLAEQYWRFAIVDGSKSNEDNVLTSFPSQQRTFCQKCQIERPPRCHHCSQCHRCVLQFDHHCVWINNCVGYHNYRHFFLLVLFMTVGCWYGCVLLYRPFYEPLKQQIRENGWQYLYNHKTGFLDLPPLTILLQNMVTGTLDTKHIVKIIFPLLTAVGLLQTLFLGYHITYTCRALTTLEYKILLEQQYEELLRGNTQWKAPTNPFSRGSWDQNFRNALGPWYLLFVPVSLDFQHLGSPQLDPNTALPVINKNN